MKKQLAFVREGKRGLENLVVLEFTLDYEEGVTQQWLLDQLIGAVTAWIEGSPEGDEAWRLSNHDLNIGDVIRSDLESLEPFLRSHSIRGMRVVYEHSSHMEHVAFDTYLNAKA